MSIVIQTKNLVKRYGSRTVVNDVSFNVKQGEIVGLLGPNGAGKTTSFYQVVGLVKPDEGEVFLNDINITKLPMYKRAQMGIGYLPQEASVFRKLSVEENIMAVLEMTKLKKTEQKLKLESLLEEFRLQHVRKNNGDTLSGGERRRTEIARALAVDPKFILLDEPFAGVDPIAVEDIQEIIAKLKYKNIGILITDHNVNETLSICDRAYVLWIPSDSYTPARADSIPTGEILPLKGTLMDFNQPTRIGDRIEQLKPMMAGYDHNYILAEGRGLKLAARLLEPKSGRMMEVRTTQPAIQLYTGNHLGHTAVCLETQHYPDAIHHPNCPSVVLRPAEHLRETTIFTFLTK